MRTIFEDTNVQANLEEETKRGSKILPLLLWLVALIFVSGTWGVYRWVVSRPAPQPPAPPVSLADPKQTSEAFAKFNRFVREENWIEAEKMLSVAAQQKLTLEQKSLRDSILGDRKDDKIVEADSTPSVERTPDMVRVDYIYKFTDGQYKIIPLVLVLENGKLVINSWSEVNTEGTKKS